MSHYMFMGGIDNFRGVRVRMLRSLLSESGFLDITKYIYIHTWKLDVALYIYIYIYIYIYKG
jgi:hypothetical protein